MLLRIQYKLGFDTHKKYVYGSSNVQVYKLLRSIICMQVLFTFEQNSQNCKSL